MKSWIPVVTLLLVGCDSPPAEDTDTAPVAETAEPFYQSAEACGECHPTQYAEWRQSMHAYAARSPVFDAMDLKAFRDSGGALGTFCTGCHTPQGEDDGEPGSSVMATRSELSKEGINCDGCHTAVGHDGPTGDAKIVRELGNVKQGPFEGGEYGAHSGEYSSFVTSSELCGSCHDVFAFPGLRIEEAFTEYADSPAAEDGTRCQDCHMSPVPGKAAERSWGPAAVVDGVPYPDRELSSHRFIGPDYTLLTDFPYPDDLEASAAAREEYLTQQQTLLENAIQVSYLGLRENDDGKLVVSVGLESLFAGHNVPTGFTSERQLWVDISVVDADGNEIFRSGDLDSYGDLRDVHSWEVEAGTVPLDDQLVNLQSTNLSVFRQFREDGSFQNPDEDDADQETTRVELFPFDANTINKNSIPPLETRHFAYLADATSGPYTVTATLRYRNLPPNILRALGVDEYIPRLHIADVSTLSDTFTVDLDSP